MILTRRILSFTAPVLFGVCFIGLISAISGLWWWVGALFVLACLTSGFLLQWHIFSARFFWITVPLLLLLLTSAGVIIVVPNEWIRLAYAVVAVAMSGVYIEDVFILYYQPQKYTQLSLPQFSLFLNVWSAYGIGLLMFATALLNIVDMWVMLLIAAVFGLYLGGHVLWSFALWKKELWFIPCVFALMLTELTWILLALPFSFVVTAFLLCIMVYILSTLTQLSYRNAFTFDTVVRPVVISLVGSVAILLTTQWFY